MSDLISRADAIAYIDRVINSGLGRNKSLDYIRKYISALPSAELPKGELISRADAIEAACNEMDWLDDGCVEERKTMIKDALSELPSADAEFADLPDIPRYYYEKVVGNMAHEINMLKEQLESAEAVQGEWVCKEREYNDCDGYYAHYWYECSVCGARPPKNQWKNEWHSNFCPSCGARMKGGAK